MTTLLPPNLKVHLALGFIDMRKGIDSLAMLVQGVLQQDPFTGHLMSTMKGVRVDPKNRTVRVGPGCTTGDVDHATHVFGQAVPFGIISTTGVAGLTLSGGHGYLGRQYGLASDNLIEADVVLADGSFLTANEAENADLLWALRGGGGNFGVVTSFLFRTHPAKVLYGGPIIFDLADAAPFTGHLFVFRGRTRANLIKIIYWDGTGFCLFTKRLEHGVFLWPPSVKPDETPSLTSAQLSLLIEGVDWRAPEQRWRPALAG